jgi:hypothetical protein
MSGVKGKHIALDEDGNPLPYTPAQVRDITTKALKAGMPVLVVVRMPNEDIVTHVFSQPSRQIADLLDTIAMTYRKGLWVTEHKGE